MIWLHKSVGRMGMWNVSTTSECSPIKTYHNFLRPHSQQGERRRDGVTKAAKRHLLLFQLVRLMITQFPLNWIWAENMEYFLTPDQGAYSIKTNPISSSCEWVIGKWLTSLWLLYMRHRMLRSRWMLCARPACRRVHWAQGAKSHALAAASSTGEATNNDLDWRDCIELKMIIACFSVYSRSM